MYISQVISLSIYWYILFSTSYTKHLGLYIIHTYTRDYGLVEHADLNVTNSAWVALVTWVAVGSPTQPYINTT